MNEATGTGGKEQLAGPHRRTGRSNKEPRASTTKEMERSPANPDKSPPKKKRLAPELSTEGSAHTFEATAAGASSELSMLVSTFAGRLSEKAAANTCHTRELESLLTEARNLESYLKEKKTRLKQTLAVISSKLQG